MDPVRSRGHDVIFERDSNKTLARDLYNLI